MTTLRIAKEPKRKLYAILRMEPEETGEEEERQFKKFKIVGAEAGSLWIRISLLVLEGEGDHLVEVQRVKLPRCQTTEDTSTEEAVASFLRLSLQRDARCP